MRRVHLAAVAVAATAVVLVGLRACATSPAGPGASTDDGRTPEGAQSLADAGPGPREILDGVPQGWSHDSAGARAAAISAVRLTGDIARSGFITRADTIEALATTRYGPTLAEQSAAQLDEITGDLDEAGVAPDQVLFSELPLTAEVTSVDGGRAQVEVWSVLVVAVPERGAPRQAWRTVTVDLAWERGDWRIDGWTARAGPTPALATEAPIGSFDELAEVAGWASTTGFG